MLQPKSPTTFTTNQPAQLSVTTTATQPMASESSAPVTDVSTKTIPEVNKANTRGPCLLPCTESLRRRQESGELIRIASCSATFEFGSGKAWIDKSIKVVAAIEQNVASTIIAITPKNGNKLRI